jgi:hypothetical protein
VKVPGLKTVEQRAVQFGKWYVLEANEAAWRDATGPQPKLDVNMRVAEGVHAGTKFIERFFITPKAVNRLRLFLSRATYAYDDEKRHGSWEGIAYAVTKGQPYSPALLLAEEVRAELIAGLRLWAALKEETDKRDGQHYIKVDGWAMRSLAEGPPEEEATTPAIDYGERDALEKSIEGLE